MRLVCEVCFGFFFDFSFNSKRGLFFFFLVSCGLVRVAESFSSSCLGNLCYAGLADVSAYLNRADVLNALGVNLQYVGVWSSFVAYGASFLGTCPTGLRATAWCTRTLPRPTGSNRKSTSCRFCWTRIAC